MAQQSAVARGQQGGDEVPFLGEQFWRHRRVHAPMDEVQLAGAEGAIDCVGIGPRGKKLRTGDDSRLARRNRPNCRRLPSDSGGNQRQFGHVAMVGAIAVPTQRSFATTQPKNRRGSPRGSSTTRPAEAVVIRLR